MLRAYQSDIVERILSAFRSSRSVLVQMPTGTGKTLVLGETVRRLEGVRGKGGRVLVVAHRRELVAQIEETSSRLGLYTCTDLEVHSIQWLSGHADRPVPVPSLVVIDEAHHALAATYRMMWDRWPGARFLGLTATPCRLDGRRFTDLFGTLVRSWSPGRFVLEGWLSLFDYYGIRGDSTCQRLVDSLAGRGADGDYQVKEMDSVLNRLPCIARLHEGLVKYAAGRKGIVYAVSTGHARRISEYYRSHGVSAVSVDCRTPAPERLASLRGFREGRIRVLVNVDLFSEGFDCPDVEFVQLARPTLSLSKYLQMVGRGLRRTSGKRYCVILDHVGLHRLFGLPVSDRDWQSMFEGRLPGRGLVPVRPSPFRLPLSGAPSACVSADADLEKVVSHDRLLSLVSGAGLPVPCRPPGGRLHAYRDRGSGLYGLMRGGRITVFPRYPDVFDVSEDIAAVSFGDGHTGVVDADGNVRMRLPHRGALRFLSGGLLSVSKPGGGREYIDLRNGRSYVRRPVPVRVGGFELLKSGGLLYFRTVRPPECGFALERCLLRDRGFYLSVSPRDDVEWFRVFSGLRRRYGHSVLCQLSSDDSDVYGLRSELPDGSIVVTDRDGECYHVEEGRAKRHIGSSRDGSAPEALSAALDRIREVAEERRRSREERRRMSALARLRSAEPFRSGSRWGLMLDGRVVVPPVYRSIRNPVGNYRAVEKDPRQWGVIRLDGLVVVEMRYSDVQLAEDGTARLTPYPGGSVKTVRLGR